MHGVVGAASPVQGNKITPHGEATPKTNTTSYPQVKRKPGQLPNEIIGRIIEYPEVGLFEIASELRCSLENVRKVYKKIQENPKFYAVAGGHDFEFLSEVLWKRANKVKTRQMKFEWRGKADWPAKKVASQGIKGNMAILAYREQFDREI